MLASTTIPVSSHCLGIVMGGSNSKDKNGKNVGVYAELISGKGDASEFPPIKVLLNEQITNSAVDSLKDSEEMMHLLAKNLIIETLQNKSAAGNFGQMLSSLFDYEVTLSQTRSLLYWSLTTPDCMTNLQSLSAYQLKSYATTIGIPQVSALSQSWVVAPASRKEVVSPLLVWVLKQKAYSVDPSALSIQESLPYAKEAVKDGLKHAILENLKSESSKTAVKDMIVQNLVNYRKQFSAPSSIPEEPDSPTSDAQNEE